MLEQIKKLREMTSLGINECRSALKESEGNFDKALRILRDRRGKVLAKKTGRQTSQGSIGAYVHFGGNLGAMVEVNCETDFVARTDVFKKFVKDLAMQVAASSPQYINREDIPEEEVKNISKLDEYVQQICLLEQPFIKDNKKIIADYLKEVVSKTGENVVIRRFVRFALGEQ